MGWAMLVKALLQLVILFVQRMDDEKQRQLGRDEIVRKSLAELVVATQSAKAVDVASASWTVDDVNRILRDSFRD